MNQGRKLKINYISIGLIIAVVILTVFRICSSTTQNTVFYTYRQVDNKVEIVDARYLELELDAPMAGLTGFGFQFEGNRRNFGDAGFLVKAAIENDPENPQILFEEAMPLLEQPYDYQNECYRVIVPFEGEVHQGDHLRIAIMGMGMAKEDGITIQASSVSGIPDATFEINDFIQNNIVAGTFYYQTKQIKVFPKLVQGVIFILIILLVEELRKKNKNKKVRNSVIKKQLTLKVRMVKLLPVLFFLAAALDYTYYAGVRPQLHDLKPEDQIEINLDGSEAFRELCDGEAIFCQGNIAEDRFGGLGIYLQEPYSDNGVLTIEVSDLDDQNLITSAQAGIYELPKDENGFLKFNFDSLIKKSAGKEYIVSIYYTGAEPISFLADGSEENNPRLIPLYQKNDYLNVLFLIFGILIIGFTLVIFWCRQNKMKVEKLLLIAIIFLGILFETVINPFAVPDEAAHIDTAYRISNRMLGIEDSEIKDAIYKRESDIYPDSGVKRTISAENYEWIYDDWFNADGAKNMKLVFTADVTANANELFFLPVALAITVARILGMGFLPMIFLARTTNLIIAAWMIYVSVKKLPFGKSVLCVIAMLPLTLQEIASCSYDALIIAVSIVYVSYCVFAIYSKAKLRKKDILVITITVIMLGICKGGVYTPLYLLIVWALIKRGYIKFPEKKNLRIVSISVVAGIVLVGIIGIIIIGKQPIDVYSLKNKFYPLAYLIRHPLETFRILENTFYACVHQYLIQYIGIGLGYFQISTTFLVPVGYILLIGAAVICGERYPYIVNNVNKCMFVISAFLVVLAVHAAFLLSYTIYGNEVIGGVQGRYFIPVLWLLLISLRRGRIINQKKSYRGIVTVGYLLGIGTVMQVVINVLSPVG